MEELKQRLGYLRLDKAWGRVIEFLMAHPDFNLDQILEALNGDEHEVVVALVQDLQDLVQTKTEKQQI